MDPEEVIRLLDALDTRLGPTGRYIFDLAVRQVYIEAALGVILLGLVALGSAILGRWLYRWVEADSYGGGREYLAYILYLTVGGLAVVLAGIAVGHIVPALNPEYAAIRDILSTLR
jgi:hypothetical protein